MVPSPKREMRAVRSLGGSCRVYIIGIGRKRQVKSATLPRIAFSQEHQPKHGQRYAIQADYQKLACTSVVRYRYMDTDGRGPKPRVEVCICPCQLRILIGSTKDP